MNRLIIAILKAIVKITGGQKKASKEETASPKEETALNEAPAISPRYEQYLREEEAQRRAEKCVEKRVLERETKSEELRRQLPEERKQLLPDSNLIVLTDVSEQYIRYERRTTDGLQEAFIQSYHPFISQFTKDTASCAVCLLDNLLEDYQERALPWSYQLFQDKIKVLFSICYWHAVMTETRTSLEYVEERTESQHDGGGSSYYKWTLQKASESEPDTPLRQETEVNRQKMPPSRGFWIKNGKCLIADPWGIPGLFEFTVYGQYFEYYDSEPKITSIP